MSNKPKLRGVQVSLPEDPNDPPVTIQLCGLPPEYLLLHFYHNAKVKDEDKFKSSLCSYQLARETSDGWETGLINTPLIYDKMSFGDAHEIMKELNRARGPGITQARFVGLGQKALGLVFSSHKGQISASLIQGMGFSNKDLMRAYEDAVAEYSAV